jgi:hypothetical protein
MEGLKMETKEEHNARVYREIAERISFKQHEKKSWSDIKFFGLLLLIGGFIYAVYSICSVPGSFGW